MKKELQSIKYYLMLVLFSSTFLTQKNNRLFYMCLKRGYGIFNSILQSYPNDNAKLQNLIKREGGVYFDYQDSKDKQVLDLHFYWKEYTPTIP